jgi:prevent-host-death family protein
MKTVTISRFRRDCVDILESARQTGAALVVTRRGKPVARVMPWSLTAANDARLLTDQMEFAGDGTSPIESSWSGGR